MFSVVACIIIGIIVIIIKFVLAHFMTEVAYAKGYDDSAHAYGMTFWLGLIGCLYVIALPDLILREQNNEILNAIATRTDNTDYNKDEPLPPL